ncbi:OPT oligopeptide transporter protein-domain-containing protein [Aspergillus similis]
MVRFTFRCGGKPQQSSKDIKELPPEKVQSPETKDLGLVGVRPLEAKSRTEADSADESQYDFDSAEFKNIPEMVRTVVEFEDDASLPVLTFRSILLSAIFCTLGSIVSQLSYFRTTTAPFPVFFVILASDPLGRFLARVLPTYKVPLGRFLFSLNPGPWPPKEHAIVGIAANAGSQGQWATFLPTNAALYYNMTMNPAVALFFGWGSSLLGFAFAAMVRTILIDDPEIFPLSLQQVTLYRSMDTRNRTGEKRAHDQMKILLLAAFVWQFLPEYLFPFVASLAPLCWIASRNHTVNFLGAGRGGMGLLNITLDWSNITSVVITYPYSVQVIIFLAFVSMCWILIPIAYFGKLWGSPAYDIMSNGVFQKNGSAYPFNNLIYLDPNGMHHVNETKYEDVGLAYSGAQYTWQMFMWVASYMSSYVWCALFLGPKMYNIWKARKRSGAYHQDRLSRIIQKYFGITKWEWAALTLVPTVILFGIVVSSKLYMPIWTYFVALGFGAAAMLPMSFVYAMSGFSIKVGYFNELIYGCTSPATCFAPSDIPLGQLAYRIISGNKIGHYLHLPPRQAFGVQIIANMFALLVNYSVMRWTGQEFQSYNTAGIQYVLVGPKKLFASNFFRPILWGFLAGALAPVLMWLLHRRFPRARFDLWNTTIFFASAAVFYGNFSTGPFTTFLVGTFTNFYLFRYRRAFWNKWAYIGGAALDTGFNANLLFSFIFWGVRRRRW